MKGSFAGYSVGSKTAAATNAMVTTTFNFPKVSCTQSLEYIILKIGIGHYYYTSGLDTGLIVNVSCSGTTASYSINGILAGSTITITAPISPGDKMQFVGTMNAQTGLVSYSIQDITQVWIATDSGTEPTTTSQQTIVRWTLGGSFCSGCVYPVSSFTPINIGAGMITIGSHTGSIGSYLSISSDLITKLTLVNSADGHVLAKATGISSSSTSFGIKWVQAS